MSGTSNVFLALQLDDSILRLGLWNMLSCRLGRGVHVIGLALVENVAVCWSPCGLGKLQGKPARGTFSLHMPDTVKEPMFCGFHTPHILVVPQVLSVTVANTYYGRPFLS